MEDRHEKNVALFSFSRKMLSSVLGHENPFIDETRSQNTRRRTDQISVKLNALDASVLKFFTQKYLKLFTNLSVKYRNILSHECIILIATLCDSSLRTHNEKLFFKLF